MKETTQFVLEWEPPFEKNRGSVNSGPLADWHSAIDAEQ